MRRLGLVIGHVGPEAAVGGPIALIEDGDEIMVDLNGSELNYPVLDDVAMLAKRHGRRAGLLSGNCRPERGQRARDQVVVGAEYRDCLRPFYRRGTRGTSHF